MAKRKAQINRVLLILRTTGSGRELLQGALQYARSDPYCSVQMDLMPDALTPEKVAAIRDQGIDGILTSEIGMTPAVTAAFAKLDIPMVVMSAPDPRLSARSANLAFVGVDEEGIGAQGAKYLASLGVGSFNAFGFVASYKGLPWSDLRKKGFIDTVESFDRTARVFSGPANLSVAPGSSEDLKKLETWLLDIPKPAAIMADHDTRASQIIDCCKRLDINIPGQIALIGVDNDRVICDFTKPQLSSVLPDHEQVGFRAAAQLATMMRRKASRKVKVVKCPPKTVVVRETTRPLSPSGRLVHKALAFIDLHACEGIRVTDVVQHLGVSRALADLRFREVENRSILDAILERRLAEVVRLLVSTRYSIARISLVCGFKNPKHLKRLFKSRYGATMRDFRNARGET